MTFNPTHKGDKKGRHHETSMSASADEARRVH